MKHTTVRLALTLLAMWMTACMATKVQAQTIEPHISFGVRLDKNSPPENLDIPCVEDVSYGPTNGKTIKIFVLWGAFGRNGPWLSKYLPKDVRAGKTGALMFDDVRWEPLRPVGIRHGLEIEFGKSMATRMQNETVGIIVFSKTEEVLKARILEALKQAPGELVAVIRLNDHTKGQPVKNLRKALNAPNMLDITLPSPFMHQPSETDQNRIIRETGTTMTDFVLHIMKTKKGE